MTDLLTIADLTGDFVLYRDLQPCDTTLPGLADLRTELGLAETALPRKRDADYARVVLDIVRRAQARRGAPQPAAFLVVGDTDNDRWMTDHLRAVSGLPSLGFIGADQPSATPALVWEGDIAVANRWALLDEWRTQVIQRGLPLNETVLMLDIDKTLLGPRGRSDAAIDDSRAEGALKVASETLGAQLDEEAFRVSYTTLCRKEYHSLTLDNQDYVVYLTLLLAAGILSLDALRQGMAAGNLGSFKTVLHAVDTGELAALPPGLAAVHAAVRTADAAGDPTPFKAFRRAEFAATVARMSDGRLTLCREVVEVTRALVAAGALCVAASDKPAEASLPTEAQVAEGLLPLHRTTACLG